MAPLLDPLLQLRTALVERKPIKYEDDHLEIDGRRIHRSRKCAFKINEKAEYLDIGSIYFMYKTLLAGKEYTLDSARKSGFHYVGLLARADLTDFLAGKAPSCKGIVKEVFEGKKRIRENTQTLSRTRPRISDRASSAQGRSSAGQTASAGPDTSIEKAMELTYADVQARVRPLKELDLLVRCPGRPVPNAELILKIAQDELKLWHHNGGHRLIDDPRRRVRKLSLLAELEQMVTKDSSRRPIIMVPCNKRAPVNILSAAKLLQDGEYSKADEDRAVFFESTRDEFVEIVRNIGGRLWTFEVRDTTKNFTKSHWLRVVAVITDGTDWQLKGWPFETTVDLFTTIKGIYFAAVGAPVPIHVTQWAVSILNMAPLQFQHRFASLRDAFWVEVERFLKSFRHRKFVNHTTLNVTDRLVVNSKPVL